MPLFRYADYFFDYAAIDAISLMLISFSIDIDITPLFSLHYIDMIIIIID
jgi:hypothetical protein